MKDLEISLVDRPHWVNHIYLCLYCIVYLLCFISTFVFILLLRDLVFLTRLDSRNPMRIKYVLYVYGLKKNLLSISALVEKRFRVSFIDVEVLMCSRGKSIDDAIVIGVQEGCLYKLKGHSDSTLVHNTVNPSELWHIKVAHIHYRFA